jgi:hypothetical protein
MDNNNSNKLDSSQGDANVHKLIIYQDKFITITHDEITINYYYLWYPMSKKINFSTVKNVDLINLTLFSGRFKFWGINHLMYWYHMDINRHSKKEGIILDLGRRIKPAITPNNVIQVYEILLDRLEKR